jgi:hypothetical protein
VSDLENEIAEQMGDDEPDETPTDGGESGDAADGAADSPGDEVAPSPRSQADIEKIQQQLEKEAARHDKRVREIMGDDYALLVPSPIDWTPGYLFNVPGMLPFDEQVAQLDAILGRGSDVELREADDAEGCDKCNALGEVLTGSRKPGQETKPCSACTGTGWRTKLRAVEASAAVTYTNNTTGNAGNMVGSIPVADRWGRPVGHPHYNMEPASVGL